jgi:hypothetical protein
MSICCIVLKCFICSHTTR